MDPTMDMVNASFEVMTKNVALKAPTQLPLASCAGKHVGKDVDRAVIAVEFLLWR